VADVIPQNFQVVRDTEMLDQAFEPMRVAGARAVPVQQQGELVGVLRLEDLGERMMVTCALRKCRSRSAIEDTFSKL